MMERWREKLLLQPDCSGQLCNQSTCSKGKKYYWDWFIERTTTAACIGILKNKNLISNIVAGDTDWDIYKKCVFERK